MSEITRNKPSSRSMFLLEGNIGAGKTSLGNILKDSQEFEFLEEPVDTWRDGFAGNLFEMFYTDMPRWSFTFQIMAFTTRAKTWSEILEKVQGDRVVLERSIYTDRNVFAKNLYAGGAMNDSEWQVYQQLWEFLASNYCEKPQKIIYLRTPAELCLERIKKRGRNEEQQMPLDYLKNLEDLHDEWLMDHPDVILIDGTRRWSSKEIETMLI
ncbi:MAG: deoxynucleoside kinase [Candidatus Marinimicrobia bacterium]|jgi:deoxyadenosine/deoxycytidine kinase|nr:deoxynucleoside kinase [Candidatus Neomarinimicrobiota bacterium]MBT3576359.1 deoxynucleoside kinase [Candidatus Neomarinimicrobiota bacterium]MBT3680057.1 deoxynucleoside kinase [Candidatus Neomarinimicrobiota bacterium]MBT3950042.1 deoxynucleoside kinase [Candidatus Neomarinimicrobiota bacterium]MBT4253988.1 deoxynucleoside kinase [Candidatus Neomarinimicrobiota bacterium]